MTAMGKLKLLRPGIEMMKLKRPVTTRVAAKDALSARLIYQDSLQGVPPSHSRFNPTALAAIVTPSLSDKVGLTMVLASGDHLSWAIVRATLAARVGLQFVLPDPVANRRQASVQAVRNLPQGKAGGKKSFQLPFRKSTFGGVLLCLHRLQPVLLQPVADRRFVLAGAFADRFEGHSLCQALF